jgi:hypothetical protein
MRVLVISIILALFGTSLRFGLKNMELKHDLQTVCDTLNSQRIYQQLLERKSLESLKRFGEYGIQKEDSITEVHRIIASYDVGFFLLRVERKKDNSIQSIFRKVKIKSPVYGDWKKAEFVIDSARQDFKLIDIQHFKAMLTQTDLVDASRANDLMCCFGGGTLSWEAYLEDGNRHYFKTFCRESAQFTEACEFMLRKVNDEDLKKILD